MARQLFPGDLRTKQWLSFYANRFDSVDVNYTFYRLPSKESCEAWYQGTPGTFRFVAKASRTRADISAAGAGFSLASARADKFRTHLRFFEAVESFCGNREPLRHPISQRFA
jgi:uncharacterized protein YecE (DUF72 family)